MSTSLHARPGCVLVAVRDYHRMEHLKRVLEKTNLSPARHRGHDRAPHLHRRRRIRSVAKSRLFSDYEKELFSHVVEMAEKEGKPVELLVVPAVNPFDALAQAANRLRASRLVTGVSARMESDELARRMGLAWEVAAGTPAPVLARSHQPGPAVDLREPGSASAAHVAGRRGPAARNLAETDASPMRSARACIIATWWESRCAARKRT